MADQSRRTAGLKSQAQELMKQYIVYDVSNRPTTVYSCHTDTEDGGACTKVDYVYASVSSNLVVKMKEDASVWDATWDI